MYWIYCIISGKIGLLAFADESPILIEESWNSKYIAVFDPLDGSTNIDVGIVTGIVEWDIWKDGLMEQMNGWLIDWLVGCLDW